MKIYGNDKLLDYRKRADEFQEKFVIELEALNNEFSPYYAKLKISLKNRIYVTGCLVCLLIFVFFLSVFGPVKDYLYLGLVLNGIALVLVMVSYIWTLKIIKAKKEEKKEWTKNYNQLLVYKENAASLVDLAKEEVIKTICFTLHHEELESLDIEKESEKLQSLMEKTRQNLAEELGPKATSEDYILYYDQWGEQMTSDYRENYDLLEVRRKKAILATKRKDEM